MQPRRRHGGICQQPAAWSVKGRSWSRAHKRPLSTKAYDWSGSRAAVQLTRSSGGSMAHSCRLRTKFRCRSWSRRSAPGERLIVDDPLQSLDSAQSRRSPTGRRTFDSVDHKPGNRTLKAKLSSTGFRLCSALKPMSIQLNARHGVGLDAALRTDQALAHLHRLNRMWPMTIRACSRSGVAGSCATRCRRRPRCPWEESRPPRPKFRAPAASRRE